MWGGAEEGIAPLITLLLMLSHTQAYTHTHTHARTHARARAHTHALHNYDHDCSTTNICWPYLHLKQVLYSWLVITKYVEIERRPGYLPGSDRWHPMQTTHQTLWTGTGPWLGLTASDLCRSIMSGFTNNLGRGFSSDRAIQPMANSLNSGSG